MPSFKDRNKDLQQLALELTVLQKYNSMLTHPIVFGEGALVMMTMERFLRAVLGPTEATSDDTLPNLLQKAMGDRLHLFEAPGGDPGWIVDTAKNFRNGLLHGDFEGLARRAGAATIDEYFGRHYRNDLETMTKILNTIMRQIDPSTGARYDTPSARHAWRTILMTILGHRANWLAVIESFRKPGRRSPKQ